jgi:polyphosphate kinase 2 (PPK2 family)
MKIHSKDFRVGEGGEVSLKKWPTSVDPVYKSKDQYKKIVEQHVAQLSEMQQLHYASNRHAILLIFQVMDTAGTDGAIGHVMSGVPPPKVAKPSASNIPAPPSWNTIFSGEPHMTYPNADGSASSFPGGVPAMSFAPVYKP